MQVQHGVFLSCLTISNLATKDGEWTFSGIGSKKTYKLQQITKALQTIQYVQNLFQSEDPQDPSLPTISIRKNQIKT